MSSEEESFAGYSSPELSPAEKRSQTLGAVICQLANDWDIVPESPEKLATNKASVSSESSKESLAFPASSISRRRGSLQVAGRENTAGQQQARSRSVETRVGEDAASIIPALGSPAASTSRARTRSSTSLEDAEPTVDTTGVLANISEDEEVSLPTERVGSQQDGLSEAVGCSESDEKRDSELSQSAPADIDMTAVAKSAALLGKVSVRLQRLSTTGCEEELPAKKTDGLDADAVADADAVVSTTISIEEVRASADEQDTDSADSRRSLRRSSSRVKKSQDAESRDTVPPPSSGGASDSEGATVRETRQRAARSLPAAADGPASSSPREGRITRSNREAATPTTKAADSGDRTPAPASVAKRIGDDAPKGRIVKRTGDTRTTRKSEVSALVEAAGGMLASSVTSLSETGPSRATRSTVESAPTEELAPSQAAGRGDPDAAAERKSTRSGGTATAAVQNESSKPKTENKEGGQAGKTVNVDEPRLTRRSVNTADPLPAEGRRTTRSNQEATETEGRFTRSGQEIKPLNSLSPEKKNKREETKAPSSSPKKSEGSEGVVVTLKKKKKKKLHEKGKILTESDVIRRVHELKSKGLWNEKKLPKCVVEQKTKVHWDFVLEEMTWLADVVQKEVKIKKANAKKCAAMVQKFFKDKELNALRAEKAREANLRKIALTMSREVKGFWGNAQKLFEWRVKQKLERKRKEALDQHLNFIVDKTEKYSTLLAESLAESASGQVSRAESVCSGETEGEVAADQEYNPDSASSDDEETIDQEETIADKQEEEQPRELELKELEEGAEVPIEELLRKYYPEQFTQTKQEDKEVKKEDDAEETKKVEKADNPEQDLGKRRRKPINFSEVEKKIREEEDGLKGEENNEVKSEVKAEDGESSKADSKDSSDKEKAAEEEDEDTEDEKDEDLTSLVKEEDKLEEYASMAAKFQPTGNTLETTTVKTKVPSLLKHTLREYQHIGLDWLVSLYERNLNGILADEMGLGKTIQTIALLAHLAVDRENWGPHLIVVPTSVMLNWEMEIKKWCPGFKVLVYFGSQKDRRLKRVGWTKPNAFHICITSYKLVIQDHTSFRRFKWQYFILDEAQHIKNFKSQRWQLLLNFASVGRLLLTGTPLQNNLMELWSLMHFLMPHVFESHRDFKEWFSNPMTGIVEGNSEYNEGLVKRLHKVLRPFLLRRLKCEVEKQLPKKYEHLVKCPLSKRQRFLYDDFMSRAKTKETLSSGNLLSVINVLMQLRKCCNHPNLFEPRPTLSPYVMPAVKFKLPRLVFDCTEYDVMKEVDLRSTSLLMAWHELHSDPYTLFRANTLKCSSRQMLHPPSVRTRLMCPTDKIRMEVTSQNPPLSKEAVEYRSPVLHLQQTGIGHVILSKHLSGRDLWLWRDQHKLKTPKGYFKIAKLPKEDVAVVTQVDEESDTGAWSPPKKVIKLENRKTDEAGVDGGTAVAGEAQKKEVEEPSSPKRKHPRSEGRRSSRGIFSLGIFASEKMTLAAKSPNKAKKRRLEAKARESELYLETYSSRKEAYLIGRRRRNLSLNNRRCDLLPLYGKELVNALQQVCLVPREALRSGLEQLTCTVNSTPHKEVISCYDPVRLVPLIDATVKRMTPLFDRFIINVPKTWTSLVNWDGRASEENAMAATTAFSRYPGQFLVSRFQVQVPDTRLIQYDCGKLQVLASLLRTLHIGGHRALIFTQMTRMLDVLEAFLNYHGYVYMRLDGSTKVEMRQSLMERFNNNSKYFIFILSTRSGGVGINLTGADTVIFYDSDWNPTMDAQAQDRCHRIGQTRDVHIYRLISERTVEENILKKANQKRLLGEMAIEGGNFTTSFFKKQTIHDLFEENTTATKEDLKDDEEEQQSSSDANSMPRKSVGAVESALATAEDDSDRQATKVARAEQNQDDQDFNEQTEEDQFKAILAELSKVEVYAIRLLEAQEDDWVQGQLEAAQAEIEARKEEFDAEKLEELTQEIREEMGEESSDNEEEEDGDEDDESSESSAEMDYDPDESESDDDEGTIAKDEKEVDEKNDGNEISMLADDAEVPLEELIKQYYPEQYKEMDLDIQVDVVPDNQLVGEEVYAVEQVQENGLADLASDVDVAFSVEPAGDHEALDVESALLADVPTTTTASPEDTAITCSTEETVLISEEMHDAELVDGKPAIVVSESAVIAVSEAVDVVSVMFSEEIAPTVSEDVLVAKDSALVSENSESAIVSKDTANDLGESESVSDNSPVVKESASVSEVDALAVKEYSLIPENDALAARESVPEDAVEESELVSKNSAQNTVNSSLSLAASDSIFFNVEGESHSIDPSTSDSITKESDSKNEESTLMAEVEACEPSEEVESQERDTASDESVIREQVDDKAETDDNELKLELSNDLNEDLKAEAEDSKSEDASKSSNI